MKREITIIGGGMAGLTLGNLLRTAGTEVVVHEASAYPRHKVCGEFICGAGERLLRANGMGECLTGGKRHTTVAWHDHGRLLRQVRLPVPAVGLSRHCMDLRLAELLRRRGGRVLERSRQREGDLEQPGWAWATGRRPVRSEWIGIKAHFLGLPISADLEMHVGSGGYVGVSGVEDDRVNICGMFRWRNESDQRIQRAKMLSMACRSAGLESLAERLAEGRIDAASITTVAGLQFGWTNAAHNRAGEHFCMVGDRSGSIPPFTGNGMSLAIEGAVLAAPVLADFASGEITWRSACQRIASENRRRFGRRLRVAGLLHRAMLSAGGRQTLLLALRLRCLPFGLL